MDRLQTDDAGLERLQHERGHAARDASTARGGWALGLGPYVARSDDQGATWDHRSPGLTFPADMGITVGSVWNVRPAIASQPGVVYAGTQPAGLFRSDDWGETWAPVEEVNRHPFREFWGDSGQGASTLHTIELHPTDAQCFYISTPPAGRM